MHTYSDADYPVGTVIYHHPEHRYRKAPGISASQLKVFANQSPAHYRERFLGTPVIRSPSAAMVLGSLVHCLVLEPHQFNSRYQLQPEPDDSVLVTVPQMKGWLGERDLSTAGLKAELIERILAHDPDAPVWVAMEEKRRQGKRFNVKPELLAQAQCMADSVLNDPQARVLLRQGHAEVSVWGEHGDSGLRIKCRPDWLCEGVCIDLKTCPCASPKRFRNDVVRFGYDLQQAHYLNTLASAGMTVDVFVFIAVENEPPYLTQVYALDDRAARAGEKRWQEAMAELAVCQEDDRWPKYTESTALTLPGWYYQQYAAEIDHATA